MNILSIANQKGGVGKTTTAEIVAYYFAEYNNPKYRVLLIDLDSQGHVAPGFHLPKSDGLYGWVVQALPLAQVIQQITPTLHILTNNYTNLFVEEHIEREPFKEYFLHNLLQTIKGFDLIVLDTPPSNSLIHNLALVASDFVVIPANMDFLALDGVVHLLQTISSLAKFPQVTPPTIIGILPTMFDTKTKETLINLAELQKTVGADMVLPPIPRDTKIREASSHGQTIWDYAPKSRAAIGMKSSSKITNSLGRLGGYLHLCEIISRCLSSK